MVAILALRLLCYLPLYSISLCGNLLVLRYGVRTYSVVVLTPSILHVLCVQFTILS